MILLILDRFGKQPRPSDDTLRTLGLSEWNITHYQDIVRDDPRLSFQEYDRTLRAAVER